MQVTKQKKTDQSTFRRFCSFRLSGRLYGVDIGDVKEINTETSFTPIFHATKEIKGYINIRGQIFLLLDLRTIFGFPDKQIDESSRVVLFMAEVGELCGILVDSIEDVVTVDTSLIEDRRLKERDVPEGLERRAADVGIGVCKLESELLVLLDARSLVQAVIKMQIRQKIA